MQKVITYICTGVILACILGAILSAGFAINSFFLPNMEKAQVFIVISLGSLMLGKIFFQMFTEE